MTQNNDQEINHTEIEDFFKSNSFVKADVAKAAVPAEAVSKTPLILALMTQNTLPNVETIDYNYCQTINSMALTR